MRKRYLILVLILLLFIIPISVFAIDDIKNNLLGITKKKIAEVTDVSKEIKKYNFAQNQSIRPFYINNPDSYLLSLVFYYMIMMNSKNK